MNKRTTFPIVFAVTLLFLAPAALAQQPVCHYDAVASGPIASLTVDVTVKCEAEIDRIEFPGNHVDSIKNIRTPDGSPVEKTARGWKMPPGGLRYTADLAETSTSSAITRDKALTDDTVMTTLDTWIGMPEPTKHDAVMHIRVITPNDLHAMHAMQPTASPDVFHLTASGLSFAGYGVFSKRPGITVEIPGTQGTTVPVTIHAASDDFAMGDEALANWVEYFAQLNASYWDGFPVPRLLVAILPSGYADRVSFGRVRGGGGATLQVVAGRGVTPETLYTKDWILTHELLHLAQPYLPRNGTWLMEGMATYVEPLLRHFAGLYTEDAVWNEWLNGMPTGALGWNTSGLERANPYWSGALALLVANVAIVEESNGKYGIADCLLAGLRKYSNATSRGRTSALIRACDNATGTTALSNIVTKYKTGGNFDLPQLWRKLGVSRQQTAIRYDENPNAARLRSAILSPPNWFRMIPSPYGHDVTN